MTAWIGLVAAIIGLAGSIINSLGWHRHARLDNNRFADVNQRIDDGTSPDPATAD